MSKSTFKPGQLVRLKDPSTLTPKPGEEPGDEEYWKLIQNIPMYYLEEAVATDEFPDIAFPHRATVVAVFRDVVTSRHNYEEYANFSVPKGCEEWHFREGELEAIPDE